VIVANRKQFFRQIFRIEASQVYLSYPIGINGNKEEIPLKGQPQNFPKGVKVGKE
jgi:hypothetical protein